MKGWKTIIFNLAIALLPVALTNLLHVDWTTVVSPNTAALIVGAIGIVLRTVTTTPVGKA